MKRVFGFVAVLALVASLAHAQTKGPATVTLSGSTTANPALSWTAPAAVAGGWTGCTASAPCTYQVYVLTGTCPATVVGSTGWSAILPLTAITGTTYTDTLESAGTTESYVVYTEQTVGGAVFQSAPSNCVTVAVPFAPSAPGNVTGAS